MIRSKDINFKAIKLLELLKGIPTEKIIRDLFFALYAK
jgi:hypothetical protein